MGGAAPCSLDGKGPHRGQGKNHHTARQASGLPSGLADSQSERLSFCPIVCHCLSPVQPTVVTGLGFEQSGI